MSWKRIIPALLIALMITITAVTENVLGRHVFWLDVFLWTFIAAYSLTLIILFVKELNDDYKRALKNAKEFDEFH